MRKLLIFTLGFAAAVSLCAYRVLDILPWYFAVIWAALGVAGLVIGISQGFAPVTGLAIAFLGFALGLGWFRLYESRFLAAPAALDGQTAAVSVRATDYSAGSRYGSSLNGEITLDGRRYQVRCYLSEYREITPGTVVTGTFRFTLTVPEAGEEISSNPGKGIFLLASQRGEITVQPGEATWRDIPAYARKQIRETISRCFPKSARAFAKALVLGDTTDLDYETDTALKLSGIRHVAAVSGLHVSILFALISLTTLRRRWLTAILGIPALVFFAALAGFSPSVVRACIMAGLMLLAPLVNQEYDPPTALSFAVLVMLAVNPLAATSASLQLSVASVSGIFLFSARIRDWLEGKLHKPKGRGIGAALSRWFCGSVSVSLSSCVFSAPLSAWYFGTVSLVGVLTNLLTLWAISFIFYGILAACLVYLLHAAAGILIGRAVSVLIGYVLTVAKVLSQAPMAAVYTCSPYIVGWLVLVYLLLAVFLLSGGKRPTVLLACAAVTLCAAVLVSWAEPWLSDTRMTVLDVGQGQCILLQAEGRTYMIDCGGDQDDSAADTAAQMLLSQGIFRLDGLILTHWDQDHMGGVEYLLSRIPADMLILPPQEPEIQIPAGTEVFYASQDLTVEIGQKKITVYAPESDASGNDFGLCILYDSENCDILITGDASQSRERELVEQKALPEVDILVAGHHGSAGSTGEELLAAVSPDTVCISVGEGNTYGHPAQATLERLEKYGCRVYRTDLNGTVVLRR